MSSICSQHLADTRFTNMGHSSKAKFWILPCGVMIYWSMDKMPQPKYFFHKRACLGPFLVYDSTQSVSLCRPHGWYVGFFSIKYRANALFLKKNTIFMLAVALHSQGARLLAGLNKIYRTNFHETSGWFVGKHELGEWITHYILDQIQIYCIHRETLHSLCMWIVLLVLFPLSWDDVLHPHMQPRMNMWLTEGYD